MATPGFPLYDLVAPSIDEISDIHITQEEKSSIKEHLLSFIDKQYDYETLCEELTSYPTVLQLVEKVKNIMDTEKNEIPTGENKIHETVLEKRNKRGVSSGRERHKTRQWSEYEDNRLLMGVRIYGLDNWNAIAKYVGNGRLRSQCMQRWTRGLDPRISKKQWTKEEEEKLLKLVAEFKDKSWTRISAHFGNRSDVQCRYKYIQLCRSNKNSESSTEEEIKTEEVKKEEPEASEINYFSKISLPKEDAIELTTHEENELQIQPNNSEKKNQFTIPIFSPDLELNDNLESPEIGFCNDLNFDDMNLSIYDISATTSTMAFF